MEFNEFNRKDLDLEGLKDELRIDPTIDPNFDSFSILDEDSFEAQFAKKVEGMTLEEAKEAMVNFNLDSYSEELSNEDLKPKR